MWWQRPLSEFVTLLLVVNPFGVLPVYLAVVATIKPSARRKLALHAVLVAFIVLVFFVFAGAFLFQQMGIPILAFQISGGIVLFLIALETIRGEMHAMDYNHVKKSDMALAVYPIGIPKIAGPCAMLAVILLTDDDRSNIVGQFVTIGVLALVLVVTLLFLLAAGPISRLIGVPGASIIARITGMLLAALAVSLVLGAVGQWLNLPQL